MTEEKYIETHIGDLLQIFLEDYNLSQNALAVAIRVPSTRINAIIKGKIKITADTDLRLCKYFGLTEGYFLRIQASMESKFVKRYIQKDLDSITPITNNLTVN